MRTVGASTKTCSRVKSASLGRIAAASGAVNGMAAGLEFDALDADISESIRKGVRPPGFRSDFDTVWGIRTRLRKGTEPFSNSLQEGSPIFLAERRGLGALLPGLDGEKGGLTPATNRPGGGH